MSFEVTSNTLILPCEDKDRLSKYYRCIRSLFAIRECLWTSVTLPITPSTGTLSSKTVAIFKQGQAELLTTDSISARNQFPILFKVNICDYTPPPHCVPPPRHAPLPVPHHTTPPIHHWSILNPLLHSLTTLPYFCMIPILAQLYIITSTASTASLSPPYHHSLAKWITSIPEYIPLRLLLPIILSILEFCFLS